MITVTTLPFTLSSCEDTTNLVEMMTSKLQLIFENSESVTSLGTWTPSEILQHCENSIAYAITEYPRQKSAFIKHTIGKAAFHVFDGLGAMKHSLTEKIPGEADFKALEIKTACSRLVSALDQLSEQNKNMEHFFFGSLSPIEMSRAQYLHIQNHLEDIVINRNLS